MEKPEAKPPVPPVVSFESLKGGEWGSIQRVVPEGEVLSDDLADQWLNEHGAGDLVDPGLK